MLSICVNIARYPTSSLYVRQIIWTSNFGYQFIPILATRNVVATRSVMARHPLNVTVTVTARWPAHRNT